MPGPTTHNVVNNAPIVVGTASQLASTYSGITATISLPANVINTGQTLFSAYLSATVTNVTGDGTAYTIIYNNTLVTQGSAYNATTGVFTRSGNRKLFILHRECSDVAQQPRPALTFQL